MQRSKGCRVLCIEAMLFSRAKQLRVWRLVQRWAQSGVVAIWPRSTAQSDT
jgi:hypothetical protein